MERNLAIVDQTLLDSLNIGMNGMDAIITEVASKIPAAKETIIDRIKLIEKIPISEETVGSVKDGLRDVKKAADEIDGFRRKGKTGILAHYQPIEDACKELKAEIDGMVAPIKENVADYETERKSEREILLREWIDETLESENHTEYADKIEIKNNWYNASKKAVTRGIKEQVAEILQNEQMDSMKMETYQNIINVENGKMIHDMSIDEFDLTKPQFEVIEDISRRAEQYRAAEASVMKSVSSEEKGVSDSSHGFLIRVFADESRSEEVLKILEINDIYARLENPL